MNPDELLAVGRVSRAHGVRGEVSVLRLTEIEDRFAPGAMVRLGPDGSRRLTVRSSRPHHGRILVSFEEIDDRTGAEALRGQLLLVEAASSPPPPEDGFWVHQVVGLDAVTESGRPLGPIREVLHGEANDVWVAERDGHESLIPALRDVVTAVDLTARRVTVRDVPGLLDEET